MKDETLVFLRNVQCFAELDESSLLVVNDVIQPVEFEDGEIICTEGEIGDRMYIIESGDVAVLKHPQDGESIEVTVLSRGDIAGEMGLFGHKKRSATLQTRGRAKAWAIDYSSFEDLLERHGSIARGLLSYLCRHLVRETSMVARLMNWSIRCRNSARRGPSSRTTAATCRCSIGRITRCMGRPGAR